MSYTRPKRKYRIRSRFEPDYFSGGAMMSRRPESNPLPSARGDPIDDPRKGFDVQLIGDNSLRGSGHDSNNSALNKSGDDSGYKTILGSYFTAPCVQVQAGQSSLKKTDTIDDFLKVLKPPPRTSTIVGYLTSKRYEVHAKYDSKIEENPTAPKLAPSNKAKQVRQPQQLFVVDLGKKEILRRFGDVLALELFEDIKIVEHNGSEFMLGLLIAFDTNCRPLLAGILLLRNYALQELFQTFKLMLRLVRNPKAFITNMDPLIEKTLSYMKKLGLFNGEQFFDREAVLQVVKRDLDQLESQLPQTTKQEVYELCRLIALQTNSDQTLHLLDQVCEKGCPAIDNLLVRFLERKQQKFSWAMEATDFTGLNFSCSRLIRELVRKHLFNSMSLADAITALGRIDDTLLMDWKIGEYYREPTELLFRDQQLSETQRGIESAVFAHFMRSYLRSMKECRVFVEGDKQGSEKNILVYHRPTKKEYSFVGGECECGETVTTGIPCLHLICKLRDIGANYLEYFKPRWRREMDNQRLTKPKELTNQETKLPVEPIAVDTKRHLRKSAAKFYDS